MKWSAISNVRVVFAALVGVAVVLIAASPSVAGQPGPRRLHRPHLGRVSLLYVVNAGKGTLAPLAGRPGRFTLTLTGVERHAVWFSDRPARLSGAFPSSGLAAAWKGFGFASDPPNAALDYTDPTRGPGHSVILVLRHPRLDVRDHALVFTVTVVDPTTITSGNLIGHAHRADRTPPRRLLAPSLFIDDSVAPFVPSSINGGCMLQPYADCLGAIVIKTNLAGMDLAGINFVAQMFDDNFNGANFTDSYFIGYNGDANSPSDAGSIVDSTFVGTNFTGAQMYDDFLTNLDMTNATFNGANLNNANFTGSDLAGSSFVDSAFTDAIADNTNFTNANLSHANLFATSFINANLTGANLTGASLGWNHFDGAKYCHTTMPDGSINNSGC